MPVKPERPTNVEILYCEACPGLRPALERVMRVVAEEGMETRVEVRTIEIRDEGEAERARFRASPTVRVDGRDVDPSGGEGLQCRLHPPSEEQIRAALQEASSCR
jgi:hypothetical protein